MMGHHWVKSSVWRGALVLCASLAFCSLGLYGWSAKADHGPATWSAAHQSVVVINPTWLGYTTPSHGAPAGTAPAGTGVYYADMQPQSNFILTAAHVVSQATAIEIVNSAGVRAMAEIYAIDVRRDIAVLKTALSGPAIRHGVDDLPIGSHVCAIGNSFGLGTSFSCGVVSATHRRNIGFNEIEDFIQTDAAVNPGVSGGALVDGQGRLIGLVDGIFTKDADIDAGVNFAISLSLIKVSLAEMRAKGLGFDQAN